jgi:CheY-like chemotaxis protein
MNSVNHHEQIFNKVKQFKSQQFTGILKIKSSTNLEWKLYFYLGRVFWGEGGIHPHRSWIRNISKYCPQINFSEIKIEVPEKVECCSYYILTWLLQKKLLETTQGQAFVKNKVAEILIEVVEQQQKQSLECLAEKLPAYFPLRSGLNTFPALIDIDQAVQLAQENWSNWIKNGFKSYSPHLAPVIINEKQLQQQVNPIIYQNLVSSIKGKYTLRDLAWKKNKDIIEITRSLVPYIRQNLIDLFEVADLPFPNISLVTVPPFPLSASLNNTGQYLIACIDDSPQVCRIMEQIITHAGYKFLGIQDPVQAIPAIIASRPNLIFLDIGMPMMNGYEVCSQLKKISQLKETPIIMLTGNDGIIDRVKAKVVGSSSFISKPIEIDKILNTIQEFCIRKTQSIVKPSQADVPLPGLSSNLTIS